MKVAALNPNTNQVMTQALVRQLEQVAPSGMSVLGVTASQGPAVIASRETFSRAAQHIPDMLRDVPPGVDGVLLGCFGDPGIEALKMAVSIPVAGLAEAAMCQASSGGKAFAIITFGQAWRDLLRERALAYGCAESLVDVYVVPGTGLDLMRNPAEYRQRILQLSERARADGAEILIPGGAAFAGLSFAFDAQLAIVDPFRAALNLLRHRISTNKSV